jgi:cobyrinic acid a,c-diamide synthase
MLNERSKSVSGIVIAGTHSSVGKSSIAIGLMHLLHRKGWSIKPFKVGPDYIDPGHHNRACSNPSYNLDTVMTSPNYVKSLFNDVMQKNDFAVVEGVMGLFDGASPKSEKGSTAEIAKLLNLPVLLVFDARAMARSAAALVNGFLNMDKDLRFIGAVANNVNSPKHESFLKDAIEYYTPLKLLGCIPKTPDLEIPSRHLGLVQGVEQKGGIYKKWAGQIEAHLDLRNLIGTSPLKNKSTRKIDKNSSVRWKALKNSRPFTVAVAKDKAFQFVYQDTLELFQHYGGEIVYFSPMKDKQLPSNVDWLYFPGGYPELHAKALSANLSMLKDIKKWNKSNKLVVAECGGLMYLGKSIKDSNGKPHKMAGIYSFSTTIKKKKLTLGYRKLKASKNIKLSQSLKGHEFHYSNFDKNLEKPLWHENKGVKPVKIKDGFRHLNSFAFYTHIYWGENEPWLKFLLKIVEQQRLINKK